MDPHVFGLLEEMLSSDKTPEEVCRDRPDLLPELRQRWQEFRRIDAEVGEWYLKPESRVLVPLPADPPQVPGYELESELGRGGMGVVYKARHLALKRTVALKMLVGVSADRAERVRFGIEAEAVARLQHPNIVQVHEVGEAGGLPFLALEFVPGGSLAKRLAGQPLPPRDAARLVETLADAMHLAHSRNLVHRDLKPANILLTGGDETPFSQSQPKVADFGLARQLDSDSGQTQIGTVLGTPSYMAPEQAEGRAHAAGPAADIYSLGATLYECLTGRPPFQGTTSPETLEQVRTQEPASPSSLNRQIPRDLETICLKCLRKQPEQRYSSAHELGMDLGRFLRGEPVAARPIGVAERLRKWVRRHPAYAGLVAAAVLLAAAGLWLFQQRAQRRAELRNQVGTALALAEDLRNGFHFHEARELLGNARQQVNLAGPADLRVLVNQAWDNLLMAENLDAARLRAFTLVMGRVDPAGAEPLYEKTFAQAGLGASEADSESVAAEVCKSPLRWQIVAALDDWAGITRDVRRQERLLAVARLADPDPARDSLRQPKLWRDGAKLTERTRELRVAEVSPQLATTLSRVAYQNGGDALTLLRAAQSRFPHDFWLNFELGWAFCRATKWDDAVGYSRAAVALRPEASAPYTVLATALQGKGQIDEAIERFQQALDIDPKFVWAHDNLGSALRDRGRVEEAVAHFRKALDIEPQDAVAHNNLGIYLLTNGNLDEAICQFKESLRYERGQSPVVHVNLGLALADKGRLDEAIDYFQQAARLDPELLTARIAIGSFSYNDAQSALRDAAGQGAKKKRPAAPGASPFAPESARPAAHHPGTDDQTLEFRKRPELVTFRLANGPRPCKRPRPRRVGEDFRRGAWGVAASLVGGCRLDSRRPAGASPSAGRSRRLGRGRRSLRANLDAWLAA